MKYKCKIVSKQFGFDQCEDFHIEEVLYSPKFSLQEADALLVCYDPNEDLLNFDGPKLWYTMEPSWHHHYKAHGIGKKLVKRLLLHERAHYAHPCLSNRIPHPTYTVALTRPRSSDVKESAVACVTNFGGGLWFLKKSFRLRNRMILSPKVQLFGNPDSWKNFRHFPQLWKCSPPVNYQGISSPGQGPWDEEHVLFLSNFKVAVCLENTVEPFYFTEKFVNAVRAGCIPVYHAHPTVKELFLQGAKWVDPADFGYSPQQTIEFALQQDHAEYRAINDRWLESGILKETDNAKLFTNLHQIIVNQLKRT